MTTSQSSIDQPRDEVTGQFGDKPQSTPDIASFTAPRPRKPGEYGGYQLKGMKVLRNAGMEGDAFTASIYRDGRKILVVSNSGDGGSNRYNSPAVNYAQEETVERARARGDVRRAEELALRAMATKALGSDTGEPQDNFVEFLINSATVDKHAVKHSYTRESVVEEWIADMDASPYPMSEREKYVLRNPDSLFDE